MRKVLILTATLACIPGWAELPDGPGKAVTQKACSPCHTADMVLGRAMTREQWTTEVGNMVAKGAKLSDTEFNQVVDYLATTFPPGGRPNAGPPTGSGPAARPRPQGMGAGPDDRHIVDPVSAARGKTVYTAECITCHGNKARGSGPNAPPDLRGPDLLRSLVVLHDRYGDHIGPFLAKGHPLQSGNPSASLSPAKVLDLANFIHARIDETARFTQNVINVLTGDPKAGEAYFNGAGNCKACHSPTGDLAHLAGRYDPPTLQQKMVFPRTRTFRRGPAQVSKPVMVTVTPASGPAITGELVHLDDFDVALRDSTGAYQSFKRTPAMKVTKQDPYAAHAALLDQYTDKNIHDLVAYLETLK